MSLLIVVIGVLIFSFGNVSGSDECDKLGVLLYEDLGCKPVTKPGLKCPIKYECNLAAINNTCLFEGDGIPIGQALPNDKTYGTCEVGCRCVESPPDGEDLLKIKKGEPVSVKGHFVCAILDCPEWLGTIPAKPGCYLTYQHNQCCTAGQVCRTKDTHECKVYGITYFEGQRYYEKDTCLSCICPKNFNGKHEAPHCQRENCNVQIRNNKAVQDYCAPFYFAPEGKSLCCPFDRWICPSTDDKIITVNPDADQSSDLRCQFGTQFLKLGQGLESKIKYYDNSERHARCECILPPFLTCREIKTV